MPIDDFKNLCTALLDRPCTFNESSAKIEVQCSDNDDLKNLVTSLTALSISSQELFDRKLEFSIGGFPFRLFWNLENFRKSVFTKNESFFKAEFSKDFAVLFAEESQFSDPHVFFEHSTKKTYVDFQESTDSFYFTNAESYLEFLHFLKANEHKEDHFFHFVDHFSWDTRTFVLVSATKEGNVSVSFPNEIPELSQDIDFSSRFKRLFDAFDDDDKKQKLPKFIKSELIGVLSKEPREKRLVALIEKLNQILDTAEQNFDIYLYDLSLENLKKDYLESKDKYFAQLREILGKISTQIIALPLSISAVALATYNIPVSQNKTHVILILISAFVVYSSFATFLLKLYKEDVDDIDQQYKNDFAKIEESQFFVKYPHEMIPFDEVRVRVKRKIVTMSWTIVVYFFLLTLTNSILLCRLLDDIYWSPWWALLFGIIQLFLFFVFYQEIIRPRNKGGSGSSIGHTS